MSGEASHAGLPESPAPFERPYGITAYGILAFVIALQGLYNVFLQADTIYQIGKDEIPLLNIIGPDLFVSAVAIVLGIELLNGLSMGWWLACGSIIAVTLPFVPFVASFFAYSHFSIFPHYFLLYSLMQNVPVLSLTTAILVLIYFFLGSTREFFNLRQTRLWISIPVVLAIGVALYLTTIWLMAFS